MQIVGWFFFLSSQGLYIVWSSCSCKGILLLSSQLNFLKKMKDLGLPIVRQQADLQLSANLRAPGP